MHDLADKLEALAPALDNLRNYQRQIDMDGCHVGVSRQALDEVLDAVERALRERDLAVEALRGLIDDDSCRHDHHGYCQTHFISSPCEMANARTTLASIEGAGDE